MTTRHDAIYNMQRAALLQAALAEKRFDLINEALRDRLHQPYRAPLAPGIPEVLHLNEETHKFPGLLGTAISGGAATAGGGKVSESDIEPGADCGAGTAAARRSVMLSRSELFTLAGSASWSPFNQTERKDEP